MACQPSPVDCWVPALPPLLCCSSCCSVSWLSCSLSLCLLAFHFCPLPPVPEASWPLDPFCQASPANTNLTNIDFIASSTAHPILLPPLPGPAATGLCDCLSQHCDEVELRNGHSARPPPHGSSTIYVTPSGTLGRVPLGVLQALPQGTSGGGPQAVSWCQPSREVCPGIL